MVGDDSFTEFKMLLKLMHPNHSDLPEKSTYESKCFFPEDPSYDGINPLCG